MERTTPWSERAAIADAGGRRQSQENSEMIFNGTVAKRQCITGGLPISE
jgi:hypothetical protein